MIVLDTNVLSELARPTPDSRVVAWVDTCLSSDLVITAITAGEVRAGVAQLPKGRRRQTIGRVMEALLRETFAGYVLAFDDASTPHYAEIVARRRRAGKPISSADAQIGAICRQYDAVLATRNPADFTEIGVELIDPWV